MRTVLRRGGRPRRCLLVVTLSVLAAAIPLAGQLAVPSPTPASDSATALLLEPGKPVRRTLAGGQHHSYRIALEAGQFAHIVVNQQGMDVVATLSAPNGTKLAESDSPNVAFGPELLWVVAESSDEYRLEVKAAEPKASAASYEVTVTELHPATEHDRKRFEAQNTLSAAEGLRQQQTAESLRNSLVLYQKAAELWREVDEPAGLARTLFFFATAQGFAGNGHEQLRLFQETLDLQPLLHDPGFEATANTWVAIARNLLGEREKALSHLDRAIEIQRALGDQASESMSLVSRSQVQSVIGDHEGAFSSLFRALAITRAIGERHGEGICLNDIAGLYREIGEDERALDFYFQALALHKAAGDRRNEANTLTNIGRLWGEKEDWPKALEYLLKALPLCRETGDRRGEAYSLNGLALARTKLGQFDQALEDFQRCLELRRAGGDRYGEGLALHGLGELHLAAGRTSEALRAFEESLKLRREDPDAAAKTVAAISRMLLRQGDIPGAREKAEEAIALVESFRARVASPLRVSYLGSVLKYYELEIDVLMRLHRASPQAGLDARALEVSERARARSLADLLTESRVSVREGVDAPLLERERLLRGNLRSKLDEQTRLLSSKHTDAQEAEVSKAIDTLLSELEHLELQIRATNPRYAALTQPEPLTVAQVQQLLDEDTLLLEYSLGEERSFLFAVSRDGVASSELPARSKIEAAARRVYESWTAPPGSRSRSRAKREKAELAEMVLSPLARQLGKKRLVVVGEGALLYVPFGALPRPVKAPAGHPASLLLADHEIVSLPSASTLAILRQEREGRRPPTMTLVVLADPVFERSDRRVRSAQPEGGRSAASGRVPGKESRLVRSARDVGEGGGFPRLSFTRREAMAIARLVPPGQHKEALDFEASRATATSGELSPYRFVHFATHGFLNTVHPELSGLVLSMVDRSGRDQEGFLPASEVLNLKLSADLVVLSACRTALGKEIRGEGLVGLTRAFMYAGAPRVVASLWRVDDAATAALMKKFYEEMLGRQKLRPAAALREAQLAVSRQKRWTHPYYWAGFVLQGEWR